MSDNLFGTQEATGQDNGTPDDTSAGQEQNASGNNSDNLFADQLAAITEDGRQKYADVATALNSIPHAQSRIKELQDQIESLKEENSRKAGFEEVLSRLDGNNNAQPSTEGESINVEQVVSDLLDQRERSKNNAANEAAVSKALAEKFGNSETALEQLKAKAASLGIGMDVMQKLAQTSPNAVLSYFTGAKVDNANPTGFGSSPANNQPDEPDEKAQVRAKLFGQADPLINKWRSASST